jgi:hypothetical protein
MVRRRDWSQAMVFRVGKKYQQTACSSACLCGNSDHCARVLSRRGFLARSAAAAAPVVLATGTDRACAQTMGSTTAASKFPADRAKRLWPLSIAITIVWSRCIMASARTPKGFMEVRTSGSVDRSANLDSRSKSQSARGALSVLYATIPNRRSSTGRCGRQCGLGGNRCPLCQQGLRPEG